MSKQSFFESKICQSRKRCWQCRVNVSYREGIASTYDVPKVNFDCPFGITEDSIPEKEHTTPVSMMAKNIAEVAVESAKNLETGHPVPSTKEEAAKYISICEECKYFLKESRRCSICKCFMDAKVKIGAGNCPAKKW